MRKRAYLPTKSNLLHRPRISALLDRAVSHSLVSVFAAMGFGKTSETAACLSRTKRRVAWLHVNKLDAVSARFWNSFLAALSYELPDIVQPLQTLGFPEVAAQFDTFLYILAEEISKGGPVILAVDDVQNIMEADSYFFLEHLVEANLENLCIVILSSVQNDMDLLGRNNSNGSIVVKNEDLACTADEVRDMLALYGVAVSEDNIRDIHKKTDGWPLAVNLIAMQPSADDTNTPTVMDISPITRIFESGFSKYSPDIRKLLVKLSLLGEFSVEMVRRIAGDTIDTAEMTQAVDQNMFIRLNRVTNLYYLQPLYKEFLAEKSRWLDADDISDVYTVAGDWFLQNGKILDATDAYGQSKNYGKLLEAIGASAGISFSRNLGNYLLGHLNAMPPGFVEENPSADYLKGFMYLRNLEFDQAESIFKSLEKKLSADEKHQESLGEVYILLAALSLIRLEYSFADYYKKASECLPGGSSVMPKNVLMIENANTLIVPEPTPGSLDKMVRLFDEVAPYIEHVMNGGGRGLNLLFSAEAAYNTFDLERATQQAYQCIYRAQENDQHDLILDAYQLLAKVAMLRGDYAELTSNLDLIRQYVQQHNLPFLNYIRDLSDAWFYANMGNLDKIAPWILDPSPTDDARAPIFFGYEKTIHPQYLMIQERFHEAIALMDAYEGFYKKRGLWSAVLTGKITRAIAYQRMGDREQSLKHLWDAYEMSSANDVITPFVEFAKFARTLVNQAYDDPAHDFDIVWLDSIRAKASSYSKRLLSMINHHHSLSGTPQPSPRFTLTRREGEVLQYLSQGMTRAEIADFLGLSENTIKSAIQNVYNKLGAVNRADAIRIATSLGYVT